MVRLSGIQRIWETGIIIACALAFFLLLALASFHPGDPGWSQAGLQNNVHNWVGPTGAWTADLFFFTFGYLAYATPFCCAFVGWFIFHNIKTWRELDYLTIGLRLIGAILIVLGLTGIASINFDDLFSFSAGGLIGDVISSALVPYFNVAGTVLLLLCFCCVGFTLLTGISWLLIIDKLGEGTIWFGQKSIQAPQKLLSLNMPTLSLPNKLASKDKDKDSDELNITSLRAEPPAETSTDKRVTETSSSATAKPQRSEPSFTIPDEIFAQDDEDEDDLPPFIIDTDDGVGEHLSAEEPVISAEPEPRKTASVTPIQPQQPAARGARQIRPPRGDSDADEGDIGPMPSFDLLDRPDKKENPITQEELDVVSRLVEEKLANFNIDAAVVGVYPGPVITRFEIDLAPGVKVSKITSLSKDLAREMSATSVRVVEVIPGKSVIGLELPNKKREMVRMSEVIECEAFQSNASALTMVLGADISGDPVVVDLAKMPHLLVAGTTGSGKSVGVNVMILSLLYKSTPEDVRMIMIDPKMLELSVYEGIPHLLAEVVTDMKEASNALRWCVGEMERRYKLMSMLGVRNLKGYNAKIKQAIEDGEPIKDPLWRTEDSMLEEAPDLEKLPSIVVVVDEFADMIMIVGKKVEELIARIAQKARAAGIHLVLATQRPSVDVITGLIKANIPTRIAFQVSSKIDSRTILDQQGAETLLGMGDMLYLPPGSPVPTRVHGAFVDDHEVHAVVADWKKRGEPEYIDEILNPESTAEILLPGEQPEGGDQEVDAFYDEAVAFVTETRRASVSSVQRKFRIGYNRAARLVEQMEQSGVVTPAGHNGNREVLAPPPPRD
ncbi:DNA translocase FtsK [Alteromonas lipolytica]|uniref:DNA translocase FtsK n=1 Tax=Alteromonas lipolytica TaxID=1856405 RepID=A0A1E8FH68_9ALTE|nr:DNA translocase FtsK [Alteromonas lipolytica]OFI35254.1 cell division protein FtsK [Alteromonas lipolytica]GGF58012.1 DNA translocase FtsK [Alteromonas lipolytica]